MLGIEGEVAVVTGAAQGNGLAIARGLAEAGAKVVLCDVAGAAAEAAAADIRANGGEAMAAELDVSRPDAAARFADQVEAWHGAAAILVNNAGIIRRTPIDGADFDADWADVFRVNVDGVRT